jgi:hypothetical protein
VAFHLASFIKKENIKFKPHLQNLFVPWIAKASSRANLKQRLQVSFESPWVRN